MSDDIIDVSPETGSQETPQAVKTLSIISIIGSSVWILLVVLGGAYLMTAGSYMLAVLPGGQEMMGLVAILLLVMILLNVLGLVCSIKMLNGKKSGFIFNAICTGIWALLLLLGATEFINLISALASIGFLIAFGTQQKNLN